MKKAVKSLLEGIAAFNTKNEQPIIEEENNMIYIAGRCIVKDDINISEYAEEYYTMAETAEYVYFMQNNFIKTEEPAIESVDNGIIEAEEPTTEATEESEIFTEHSLNNFQYYLDKNTPAGSIEFYGSVIASEANRVYTNILRILEIDRIDMDGYAVDRYNAIVKAIESSGKADSIEQSYANYITAVFSLLKIEEDRFFATGYFRGVYKCYFEFAEKQKHGIVFAGYADLNEKFYSLYNSYYHNNSDTETEEPIEDTEDDFIDDDFTEETEEEYIEEPTTETTEAVIPETENINDNAEPDINIENIFEDIIEEPEECCLPATVTVTDIIEANSEIKDKLLLFKAEIDYAKSILYKLGSDKLYKKVKLNKYAQFKTVDTTIQAAGRLIDEHESMMNAVITKSDELLNSGNTEQAEELLIMLIHDARLNEFIRGARTTLDKLYRYCEGSIAYLRVKPAEQKKAVTLASVLEGIQ